MAGPKITKPFTTIGLLPEDSNGMSFGIYLTGFVVVIIGLIYGASLMHMPTHWDCSGWAGAGGNWNSDRS
jgi:hypothetical protein